MTENCLLFPVIWKYSLYSGTLAEYWCPVNFSSSAILHQLMIIFNISMKLTSRSWLMAFLASALCRTFLFIYKSTGQNRNEDCSFFFCITQLSLITSSRKDLLCPIASAHIQQRFLGTHNSITGQIIFSKNAILFSSLRRNVTFQRNCSWRQHSVNFVYHFKNVARLPGNSNCLFLSSKTGAAALQRWNVTFLFTKISDFEWTHGFQLPYLPSKFYSEHIPRFCGLKPSLYFISSENLGIKVHVFKKYNTVTTLKDFR